MAKYKALHEMRSQFVPGEYVEEGEVVDLPTEQADGSPLIWHPDFWEPVDKKARAAAPAAEEGESE